MNRTTAPEADEICQSLKKFAEQQLWVKPRQTQNYLDDFANNGRTIDCEPPFFAAPSTDSAPKKLSEFSMLTLEDRAEFLAKLKFLLPESTPAQVGIQQPPLQQNKRKYKQSAQQQDCVFCKNNNEPKHLVRGHAVRDNTGRVVCPKLRQLVCLICGATGDNAHTIKYCPEKPIITMEDLELAEQFRKMRRFRSQDIFKMHLGAK